MYLHKILSALRNNLPSIPDRRRLGAMLVLLFLASHQGWGAAPFMTEASVYHAHDGGYFIHLNPALITTKKGSLLAFCEARVGSYADSAPIDIVLRRSFNGGNSWTPAVVVAHMQNYTVANAAPVEDRKTGVIWLLLTASPAGETQNEIVGGSSKGIRTVWITHSSDDGASWTPVQEITSSTKAQGWTWYATGPGNGIQLKNGRLLIPCDHRIAGSPAPYAHVIYSDDDGRTWKIGGSAGAETNESAVVQLADGSLLLNMRSFAGKNRRAISYSHDGGITWSPVTLDPALIEPVCQASLIRFTPMRKWRRTRLLFSNPADTVRDRMTVRLSYDEGKTWPVARLIYEGSSGYSSLAVLPDGTIGLLYDRGPGKPDPDGHWHPPDNSEISFAHFNLEWLTHGADHLTAKAK
jgi:sialidase-1